jgi:hypothetical protein
MASPIGDIGLRLKYNVGQYNLQAYKLVRVLGNEIPTKGVGSYNLKCKVCIKPSPEKCCPVDISNIKK